MHSLSTAECYRGKQLRLRIETSSCVNALMAYALRGTASLLPNNRYANSMVVLLSNLAMMRYNQSLKAQLWDWTLVDDRAFAHPYCK